MIAPSAAFVAANKKLAKVPIYLVKIAGYSRAFTMRGTSSGAGGIAGETISGLAFDFALQEVSLNNDGGLTEHPHTVIVPKATPAGNLLFAFVRNEDGGPHDLFDTAGNTWINLFDNGTDLAVYYAVSNGTDPGNVVGWDFGDIGNHSNSQFYMVEVSSIYAGFASGTNSGSGSTASATVGGNTVSIDLAVGGSWFLFLAALAPGIGGNGGVNLAWLVSNIFGPSDPGNTIDGHFNNFLVGGAPSTIYDWITSLDPISISVSDLDGSADLSDFVFNVQDRANLITASMPTFIFKGKKAQLLMGFEGMDLADYLVRYTGIVDAVDSDSANLEYKFTISDINLKKLTQKIFTVGDNPDLPIDKNNPRTLLDHPLNILVAALEEAGVSAAEIDTAKINYFRDFIFSGDEFEFKLTSAPTAKNFIEDEIMKPRGMYLWPNNLGKLSVNSFYPAIFPFGGYTPPTPPVMIATVSTNYADETQQNNAPVAQEAEMVNQVIFKFDDGGGSQSFASERIVNWQASQAKYGIVGGRTIESQGMRAVFNGHLMAEIIGHLICLRYGDNALVMNPSLLDWKALVLEPGDIIAVTNPFVPDRKAGVLGLELMAFEVMDVSYDLIPAIVQAKLLAIDLSKFKQFLITSNGEASFPSAGATDQGKYMFLCGADGKYSTGDAANTLG